MNALLSANAQAATLLTPIGQNHLTPILEILQLQPLPQVDLTNR